MRQLLILLFTCSLSCASAQSKYAKDFEEYWQLVRNNFAYFDSQKTDWDRVKAIYQPRADTVSGNRSFVQLLERVSHELYNGHVSLNVNLASSHRLIPSGADLWVEYRKPHFIITALREGYGAEQCGLQEGMRVTAFNRIPIDQAVKVLLPASVNAPDERAYEYAANTVLAGTYNEKRAITILAGEKEQTFYPDSNTQRPAGKELLSLRMLSSGIGYIRIHNSLGDNELIKAFDGALDSLSSAAALILDLRETPGGGNTTVARGLMSRFIQKEMPYQKHSLPNEERRYGVKRSWVEYVSPRGRAFTKPVVVLVGRWTGSMGEGIAIAFDGMKRAKVVGDRMAGLLGAIYSYRLTETGFGFALPVEKLFHVNGTPREKFLPLYRESDPRKCLQLGVRLLQKGKAEPRP